MATQQPAIAPPTVAPGGFPFKVWLSLFAVYVIWGSTYLGIDIAIETIPPYMMSGVRNIAAALVLFGYLRWRGEPTPTGVQWRNGFVVGALMLGGGQAGVAFSEQWVSTGLAALVVATVPLWAAFWNTFFEGKPSRVEFIGLGVGVVGVVILNIGSDLWANVTGGAVLVSAPMFWAFGSILARQLTLAPGLMSASTIMLGGGIFVTGISAVSGESLDAAPSMDSVLAMIYLIIFGSILTFSAYYYLLRNTSATVATSYAYVNPVIATVLGWALVNESMNIQTILAAVFILVAVFIITTIPQRRSEKGAHKSAP